MIVNFHRRRNRLPGIYKCILIVPYRTGAVYLNRNIALVLGQVLGDNVIKPLNCPAVTADSLNHYRRPLVFRQILTCHITVVLAVPFVNRRIC